MSGTVTWPRETDQAYPTLQPLAGVIAGYQGREFNIPFNLTGINSDDGAALRVANRTASNKGFQAFKSDGATNRLYTQDGDGTTNGVVVDGGLLVNSGVTTLGVTNAGDLTVTDQFSVFKDASNRVLLADGPTNGVYIGTAAAPIATFDIANAVNWLGNPSGAGTPTTSAKVHVIGGRLYVRSNDGYGLAIGYAPADTKFFYLGASGTTDQHLLFSNNAGSEKMRIMDNGVVLIGTTVSTNLNGGDMVVNRSVTVGACDTAARPSSGSLHLDQVLRIYANASTTNFRNITSAGSSLHISGNGGSGTDMTIDSSSFVVIKKLTVDTGPTSLTGNLGVFGTTATSKQTVTGSRAGNAALASLLTGLAAYGLITDSSTA